MGDLTEALQEEHSKFSRTQEIIGNAPAMPDTTVGGGGGTRPRRKLTLAELAALIAQLPNGMSGPPGWALFGQQPPDNDPIWADIESGKVLPGYSNDAYVPS